VIRETVSYLAAGIDADGEKHVLCIWLEKTAPETAPAGGGCAGSGCPRGSNTGAYQAFANRDINAPEYLRFLVDQFGDVMKSYW
jgi:hypothetical protein